MPKIYDRLLYSHRSEGLRDGARHYAPILAELHGDANEKLANSRESFIEGVEAALSDQSKGLPDILKEKAAARSCENIAREMERLIVDQD